MGAARPLLNDPRPPAEKWGHSNYDARVEPGRGLALAFNELRFVADDPTREDCSEFLGCGREVTDTGRWAIVRYAAMKRDLAQARARLDEVGAERNEMLAVLREIEALLPDGDRWDCVRARISIDVGNRLRVAIGKPTVGA